MLARLRANYPEVDLWWDEHEVAPKTVARKVLRHPANGRLMEVEEVMLRPAVAPELQLLINLPV